MQPGRKPKPSELRILEGNREHRPIPSPPKARPARPRAPSWLQKTAQKEWHRIARELHDLGLLTVTDLKALEAYSVCYAKWREASGKAKVGVFQSESGYIAANPLIAVELRYAKEMRAWMTEFGLTPSSRARLSIEEPDEEDEDLD